MNDTMVAEVTGRISSQIICEDFPDGIDRPLHKKVVAPFLALRERALAAGFDLRIISGFRSYERQRVLWNAKALGERPVLDHQGVPLQIDQHTENDWLQAILRWSALPGASRHHWGTDIDVYDANALPAGYEVQLIPEEVADDGMFGPLHCWLDEQIQQGCSEGFCRPYEQDRGGVSPERWHLSFGPLAWQFQQALPRETWGQVICQDPDLVQAAWIERHWPVLFERFVWIPQALYQGVI